MKDARKKEIFEKKYREYREYREYKEIFEKKEKKTNNLLHIAKL